MAKGGSKGGGGFKSVSKAGGSFGRSSFGARRSAPSSFSWGRNRRSRAPAPPDPAPEARPAGLWQGEAGPEARGLPLGDALSLGKALAEELDAVAARQGGDRAAFWRGVALAALVLALVLLVLLLAR